MDRWPNHKDMFWKDQGFCMKLLWSGLRPKSQNSVALSEDEAAQWIYVAHSYYC